VPLIPPSLDDRSYDDLVQEMLANIPAHTPEWTNPQPGDPGRTLIELFAWLADTILYRANLIPEKQRIAFLKLLGQSMQPAAAATGILSLSLDPTFTTPVGVIAPAKVPGPVSFETLDEIDLLPVTAQAYIKVPLTLDQKAKSMVLRSGLQKLYGLAKLPDGYTTTPLFANNQADPNGIDVMNGTSDQSIWLALLVANKTNLAPVLNAIGGQKAQQIVNIGFVPSISVPGLFSEVGPPAAVQATWQMSQNSVANQPIAYTTLKVLDDTTQSLTQPGVVRLMVPQSGIIGAPSNDVRSDLQAGVGSMKPPRIDDAAIAARLLTWVRLSVQSALQVSWIGVNAVRIDQRTTYNFIVIGVSDGSANQQFSVGASQIDPATFQLEIDMPGLGFQLWQQVDDLAILQGPVPAFVLDPEAGSVTFGNQLQGMIVPLGRRVRVRQMRVGGGANGNLPAGTLTSINAFDSAGNAVPQKITVLQPIATTGGADTETLDQAEQRLPALLRHQNRAVTASDYSDLAREIPGANVARVEVLPLFKPQTRMSNVAGVVSVMIIPGVTGVQNPCPRADRPLLETVYQYLDPRRPLAAEMYVIASEYVGLGISVAVEVRTGYGLLQVSQAVETALRSYLWPIPPGGADNTGWPLGGSVRSLELEVIVSQVAGVVEVNGLNLSQPLAAGGYQPLPTDASGKSQLDLESWQLPEVLDVSVAAGKDGSGIAASPLPTPPPETDPTVAVPVVQPVC
jgi:Baseplate J-like protein